MKNLCCLVTLLTGIAARSQSLRYSPESPFISLGAYSKQFTEAFSFCSNTAAIANIKQVTAGLFAERRFLLAELNQYTAVAGMPVNKGGVGLVANWFGFTDFNESQVGLAYGKQLGKVDAGLQFNYHMIRIAGYGSAAAVAVELGSTWHISKKLFAGVQLSNPAGGKYNKNTEEKLAAVYKTGIGYEASEQLFISAELIKEEDKPVNVCAGIQYIVNEKLYTRFGIATITTSPFFSAGWKWKNCRADVTAAYHPQLGITPGLMLQFFGKEKEDKE